MQLLKPPFMTRIKLYWTLQIICWGIYISYASISILYYKQNTLNVLSAGFLNFIVFMLGTHFYRISIRDLRIENFGLLKFLILPILGNIIIAVVVSFLNFIILYYGYINFPFYQPNFGFYALLFIEIFRFAMPWYIFYHGIRFAEKAIRNERDKVEAQMQLKIAELENLKNQLNPHFLFNALNSIRSLTLSDPLLARDATTKLSDLLRISLTYKNLQDIPFEEELNLVKDYLSLEKIRFENRLNYSFDVSKGILKVLVPPMSLQLLAENAVKHGISKEKLGGKIIVYAHKLEGNFVFGIKNTGSLIKHNSDKNKRQGVGLENLTRRLELNYGIKDTFKISELNKIVTSEVSIPMRMQ
jgi:sensor histidine kinase YesM